MLTLFLTFYLSLLIHWCKLKQASRLPLVSENPVVGWCSKYSHKFLPSRGGLTLVSSQAPHSCSLPFCSLLSGMGERIGRAKPRKLMDQGKDNLLGEWKIGWKSQSLTITHKQTEPHLISATGTLEDTPLPLRPALLLPQFYCLLSMTLYSMAFPFG